jgi:hypothetical protein
MTLHPWLTILDARGHVICTVPLKDANRWQFALVYGPSVIKRFLDESVTPEKTVLWTYARMINRTALDITDMETVVIGMN